MKAKFLSAFVVVALLNIDSARSGELYSDYCYQTTAVPSNGYYLAGNTMGPSTNYQSYSEVPVTLTDSYCTSGNTYVIQPSNFAAPTTSALYGALGLVHTCSTCSSGYELETYSGPFVYGDGTDSIRCTYLTNLTVERCVKQSSDDGGTTTGTCDSTNCVSDTSWTQHNTSVVKKTIRSCSADATVCNEYEEYRCAKGYVGPTQSLTGDHVSWCKRCPSYVFTDGNQIFSFETTTADIGTTSFENCYVDAESNESSFTTSIGTAHFTDSCYLNLGNCTTYVGVCTASAGTAYAVESGVKQNVTDGTQCWCNVNGKSFYVASMGAACSTTCHKDGCYNGFFGTSTTNWHPLVSWSDLGC